MSTPNDPDGQVPFTGVPDPGQSNQPLAGQSSGATNGLTKEELQNIVREVVRDENAKSYRGLQSSMSKLEGHVKDAVAQQLTRLEKAGVAVTPEQKQAIIDQTRAELIEKEGELAPANPVQLTPTTNDPLVEEAIAYIKENSKDGKLDPSDPEYATITKDRGKFLTSVVKAVTAKNDRLSSNPASAPGVFGSGSPAGTNQEILRREYDEQVKKLRHGDYLSLTNLQIQYRKKGLQI